MQDMSNANSNTNFQQSNQSLLPPDNFQTQEQDDPTPGMQIQRNMRTLGHTDVQ